MMGDPSAQGRDMRELQEHARRFAESVATAPRGCDGQAVAELEGHPGAATLGKAPLHPKRRRGTTT